MKNYLLLFFAFLSLAANEVRAQQHIPDANFAAAIRAACPTCIDANDDLTAVAATINILDVSNRNINDLTGVVGFTRITRLFCSNNNLTSLATLPDSLLTLYCNHNNLTSLPSLPNGLTELHCHYNQLTAMPILATKIDLEQINCGNNLLTYLPSLPPRLIYLTCYYNQLTYLPALPTTLRNLICGDNLISELPALPTGLSVLDCTNDSALYCLPALPANLFLLAVFNTNVECLPSPYNGSSTGLPFCSASNPNNCSTYSNFSGYTYVDLNSNCSYESGTDSLLPNTLVLITATNGDSYTTYSNGQGFFQTLVADSVVVSCQMQPLAAMLYNICTPNTYTTSANNSLKYLGASVNINAPVLSVDISTAFLRRCFASYYFVAYSNIGTLGASNVYIDIEFDSYLTYVSNSANIVAIDLGNNTYRFNIGNVAQGGTATFSIAVNVSCDAELGQVHCTNANIYPELTPSLANWSGPIIEILDSCLTDSIIFTLTNTGGAMATTQTYQIIEDNLMYRPNTPFLLGAGQSVDIVIPAQEGSIYRLEALQAVGFPAILGDSEAWAMLQNCNNISSSSANIVQQFYTNFGELSQDNDCSANRGAYDPNDKNAQILGYGAQNCIPVNTTLDYKIRFQNTGTDTAFTVVILDTLRNNLLNINTIHAGAASHNYTWELLDNGVLRFVFNNILLVDSFTNEPASQGFVSFSIEQNPNLAIGSVIENSAAIYFDFNAPVITNTAMHTICADFILLSSTEILQENVAITVSPNPFDNQVLIQVSAENAVLSLQLYDATGRLVQQANSQNNQFMLQRGDLPAGVYFYQIFSDIQPIGRGKLMAR